jgi:hypothetical protein
LRQGAPTHPDLRESQQLSDEQILRIHLKPFFGRSSLGEIDGRLIDRTGPRRGPRSTSSAPVTPRVR